MPAPYTLTIVSVEAAATPAPFVFRSVQNFEVIEGQNEMRDTVEWEQGYPLISPFGMTDIRLKFFSDALNTMERSPDFRLPEGNERLGDIMFLDNFMDNGDNSGTVEVVIRPNIINLELFMTQFRIYYQLSVTQPDA